MPLSTLVKQQLQEDLVCAILLSCTSIQARKQSRKRLDPEDALSQRVAAKIEEGDFRGAIRLAASDETLADFSDETYTALCAKHPPAHPDSQIPPHHSGDQATVCEATCRDVAQAIRSFPCGSAGGPDKLRPQHLKDMLQLAHQVGNDDPESPLLSSLTDFCNLVLRGTHQ